MCECELAFQRPLSSLAVKDRYHRLVAAYSKTAISPETIYPFVNNTPFYRNYFALTFGVQVYIT